MDAILALDETGARKRQMCRNQAPLVGSKLVEKAQPRCDSSIGLMVHRHSPGRVPEGDHRMRDGVPGDEEAIATCQLPAPMG
jgi:hypothetical protein